MEFKNMKIGYLGLLLLITTSVQAEVDGLIYQPKVLSPELKSDMDLAEYKWQLGLKLGQMLPANQSSSGKVGISANYLIWDKWYAAANVDLNEWQITPKTTESAIAWSLGAGYSVLQGAAYITDGLTLPWQLYLELGVGEQMLDQASSSFATGAIGWQLSNDNNYAALEWRYFQINDDRLQQIESDKGYEWSITFGKYF
ncbi:MAG: hypothetical protein ACI978_001349 [Oleispira sp.]